MNPLLSTVRVDAISMLSSSPRWLIDPLWSLAAVGMLGGHPKVGKSWLGLDMALSVASATPCLGRFPVSSQGPVLLFLAEDALSTVRSRMESMARARHISLADLPLHAVSEPSLRLDRPPDRLRLEATVEQLRPRLVLLDPLVRLHAANENDAGEMASLLSFFRDLQRRFDTAVLLVHHTRKNISGAQDGRSLRGSIDCWAWGDSNLFLRRDREQLLLSFEHRAAQAPKPVSLRLVTQPENAVHLEVVGNLPPPRECADAKLRDDVLTALADSQIHNRAQLRMFCSVKNERLGEALLALQKQGVIQRTDQGWQKALQP